MPPLHRTIYKRARPILAGFLILLASAVSAETIKVSGVGLSAPLLQRLADAYHKTQSVDTVTVILPPLGSTGAIRALAAGKLDLAISGRQPGTEEAATVGKITEMAKTAFGFATSDGVRKSGFTTKDVADVYAGRLTHWDDGRPIRLIMRPDRESDTMLVRRISPGVDEAMNIAAKRKGLVVAANDLDTIKLLETVPGSFGPTTTGLARLQGSPVKFLEINGALPGTQTLAAGNYPLSKPLYAVLATPPSKGAERFFAFIQSPAGSEILGTADFLPAKP